MFSVQILFFCEQILFKKFIWIEKVNLTAEIATEVATFLFYRHI